VAWTESLSAALYQTGADPTFLALPAAFLSRFITLEVSSYQPYTVEEAY
jgi:hypothetical protein